ncbi:DUF302 domain-containing protein [Bacteroidota bacterium]
MKKSYSSLAIGAATGVVLTALIIFFISPAIMFKENKSNYDFETTVAKFEKSVQEAGWKLPHVNDLQKSMKSFGHEVHKVKVFEICQPEHAIKILSQDDERIVSSLMPCRVAIYEKSDGQVYVSRMNSSVLAKPMNKIIRKTMVDATVETEDILLPLFN